MTAGRIALAAAVVVVLAAVTAGLLLTGSPAAQRELRFDERRVGDLQMLANALSRFYIETGELPETLDEMIDGRTLSRMPRDPATGGRYDYERAGATGFSLCADFARSSETGIAEDFWIHDAGRRCFDFDYSSLETR